MDLAISLSLSSRKRVLPQPTPGTPGELKFNDAVNSQFIFIF